MCLPIRPGFVTVMISFVPAGSTRWKRAIRVSVAVCAQRRAGQPRPMQRSVMRAPRGARTVSSVIRAPERVRRPPIRTTGIGRIRRGAAAVLSSTSVAGGATAGGAAAAGGVAGAGSGVAVNSGSGVAVGVGDGVGTGAAATAPLGPEIAQAVPSSLRTVSITRRRLPRSASVAV